MFSSFVPEALVQAVKALPVRVFWKDRESRYLGCNQLFADDAGVSDIRDFIGKSDHYFYHTDQAAGFRADDAEVMSGGQPKFGIEEQLTLINGDVRWLETFKVPLTNAAGEVIGVLGAYHDITERKRAEAALLVAAEA
jgi:PAS domain S-box-containing protein